MSNLVYPSPSASRTIFREDFRSTAAVVANGGVLVGAPTVNRGMVCTGTQYCTYAVPGSLLTRDRISFSCEFSPADNWDADRNFYLYSSFGTIYGILKLANANNNAIVIIAGGTWLTYVNAVDYSPHWRVGEKNRFEVSLESGNNWAWLNGVSVLLTHNEAWTPTQPETIHVGGYLGSNLFLGTIHSLEIRSELLDQQDVDAIQDNSLYSYRNRSSVWLDCKDQTVIGGLTQTTDKSGHGRNFLLGDGTTAATFPTFQNPGYLFDGATDYMTPPDDPAGTFTVAWKRANEATVFEADLTTWDLIKAAGSFSGRLQYLAWWPFALSSIQKRDCDHLWTGTRYVP